MSNRTKVYFVLQVLMLKIVKACAVWLKEQPGKRPGKTGHEQNKAYVVSQGSKNGKYLTSSLYTVAEK